MKRKRSPKMKRKSICDGNETTSWTEKTYSFMNNTDKDKIEVNCRSAGTDRNNDWVDRIDYHNKMSGYSASIEFINNEKNPKYIKEIKSSERTKYDIDNIKNAMSVVGINNKFLV